MLYNLLMLHVATDLARHLEYLLGRLLYYLLSYENIGFPQKKYFSQSLLSQVGQSQDPGNCTLT